MSNYAFQVFLNGDVEVWLADLSSVLQESVHDAICSAVEEAKTANYIDDIAHKVE